MNSVAAMAASDLPELPPEFIRPENEQPRYTTFKGGAAEVPVIDMAATTNADLVKAVHDAAAAWGIFQVVNHGIPAVAISDLQRVGREFFNLPAEEKKAYAKDPNSKSLDGYGSRLRNGWVDHLFNKIWPPAVVDHRFWPKTPSDYREVTEAYGKQLHVVESKLLALLSAGLGLPDGDLKAAVGGEDLVYNLKINYYPPCPQPDLVLGVPAHTDLSALTILVPNEVQGLQVHKEDYWYDVAYVPDALIIHIGDQIEIVSNGEYKAVLHRSVVNSEKTRISWPVFMEPPPELEVGPHPKLVGNDNPAKYKTKKFEDYAYCKLNKIPQ
ncbi:flavonol synthase/flavanone 3-hydroxylase-like [Andrographis paniculata]|uniref:flavonol synthase/flavanone 3-hydroxylase-like n=1 Tax=Andrographis paniculata TaxID=175694 RepID=UPI0021E7C137|nr:flavonol synthase/flavanone 3-hydroxylase-like [Andrographis paniculata]